MVLGPFVSVGGLMGVAGLRQHPPRALGLASPWLAHSTSPHPRRAWPQAQGGNDRDLSRLV